MDLEERNNGSGPDLAALFDGAGWALGPIVGWLMTEGRRITEPTRLADELCRNLIDAGAPLWRMRFSFQTLHPLVDACAFTWTRGRKSTEFCLLHATSKAHENRAVTGETAYAADEPAALRLDRLDPELYELTAKGSIDYIMLPLVFSTGAANTFIVATDDPSGFSKADRNKFKVLVKFLAPVLEVIATRRLARTLLDTYLGHRSGSRVLDGVIRRGDGETINAALWVSDLRDFTHLSETLPAERLLATLNAYFELITTAVTAHGGEVLRFIGDAMLVVFPVERKENTEAACEAALGAALDAFQKLAVLNDERGHAGEPPIRFGVGLHVGEVIYGNVGAPDRLDFTVMGPAVNRTARIEGLTKDLGVSVLLSAEFAARIDRPARSLGQHEMKGIAEPQAVFTIDDPDCEGGRASSTSGSRSKHVEDESAEYEMPRG